MSMHDLNHFVSFCEGSPGGYCAGSSVRVQVWEFAVRGKGKCLGFRVSGFGFWQ